MNILDKIITDKKTEIRMKKEFIPLFVLEQMEHYERDCVSLIEILEGDTSSGIIAEFKRKSPSRGVLNDKTDIIEVVHNYEFFGAAGISVLTDEIYFGGLNDDILLARDVIDCPILRKDFIIDEYQVQETKAIGADVILLIAACLTPARVKQLSMLAKELGLEVLLELHNETELGHICDEVDLIGVNNRNLQTFEVDINTSLEMIKKIPAGKIAISESGISEPEAIVTLRNAGFKGFLIGENFMKEDDPGKAFGEFVKKL